MTIGAHSTTGDPATATSRATLVLVAAVLAVAPLVQAPVVVHASTTPLLLGEQQWYKLLPHRLSDSSDLAVNVASGDLVLHSRELHIAGTGLNLALERYYNSEDTSTGMFGSWRLSTGADVNLSGTSMATFTGPSGFQATFTVSNGIYTAPPGLNAILVATGSGGCANFAYTLTFNKSGEQYCFDSSGDLHKDVDRNGDAISLTYTSGQLTSITDTQGRTVAVSYGSSGSIQRLTDSTSRFTAHTYTSSNQLYTATDANGKMTTYGYNSNGVLNEITDPLGNETMFTYSVDNRHVASITYVTNNHTGTGPTWQFTYGTNKTIVTDPNLNQTQYFYTSSGANAGTVTKVTDANGHSQQSTFTPNDDAQTLTDGLTQVTTLTYDSSNNLTSIQAPASATGQNPATYSLTYNAPGQQFLPSSTTDPQGSCRAFTYDASGNLTDTYAGQASPCSGQTGGAHLCDGYQGDPSGTCGATNTVGCGAPGELCFTKDALGHRTSYAYDSHGNLTSINPPAPLGSTSIVPDALSRSQQVTDGKGQLDTYTFDPLDRVTQILFAGTTTCNTGSTCIKYTYDGDGNLTKRVDNTGTTNFYYDPLNRLTTKSLPGGGTACPGSSPAGITFAYDGADNLTSYCDSGGTVTYGFDPANNLVSLAEPTGTCTAPTSLCTTFAYDKDNRRTKTIFPGMAEFDVGYDNAGNETSTIGKDSTGGILTRFTYTYNLGTSDTALRQTMVELDPQGSATTTYTYDAFQRLTQAATSPGTTLTYAYDTAGNRCSTATTCDGSYTYNAANELTASPGVASYSWDGNGNETGNAAGVSISYNGKNQSTAITDNGTTLSSLGYADVGQAERTAAGTTSYASSPSGVQVATSGGSSTYYTRDDRGNLIGERLPNGDHWYYLDDAIGSVVGVTGSTGSASGDRYHYDPFGQVTLNTGVVNNVWGFAGGYTDTTGLVKFGERYYDPSLGRWTQQDALTGGVADPSTINRYVYVGEDPANRSDPSGRCGTSSWSDFGSCFTSPDVLGGIIGCGALGLASAAFAAGAIAVPGVGVAVGATLAAGALGPEIALGAGGCLVGGAIGYLIGFSISDTGYSS